MAFTWQNVALIVGIDALGHIAGTIVRMIIKANSNKYQSLGVVRW